MTKSKLISGITRLYKEVGEDKFNVLSLNIERGTTEFSIGLMEKGRYTKSLLFLHVQPVTIRAIVNTLYTLVNNKVSRKVIFKQKSPVFNDGVREEGVIKYNGSITIEKKESSGLVKMFFEDSEGNEYTFDLMPTPYTEVIDSENDIKFVNKMFTLGYADTLRDVLATIPEALYSNPGAKSV